jgi:TIR domain
MPQVFISYARHDLSAIEPLESTLLAHDIAVWRDQESIYGGQKWPKAIGEAIAAHDYVVLVWSKSAAQGCPPGRYSVGLTVNTGKPSNRREAIGPKS